MAARELEVVETVEGEVQEPEPLHLLVLGDKEFVCKDDAKLGTVFFRYAGDTFRQYHEILVRAVDPEDLDAAWDAFEDLGPEEATDALIKLAMSYSDDDRPSKRPSPSRSGSRNTSRK